MKLYLDVTSKAKKKYRVNFRTVTDMAWGRPGTDNVAQGMIVIACNFIMDITLFTRRALYIRVIGYHTYSVSLVFCSSAYHMISSRSFYSGQVHIERCSTRHGYDTGHLNKICSYGAHMTDSLLITVLLPSSAPLPVLSLPQKCISISARRLSTSQFF